MVFGQSENESLIIDKAKEIVQENVDYQKALEEIDDVKGLFVHYSKETIEGSKELIGKGVKGVEQAIEFLVEESTIVVTQFIVYTSLSYLLPMLFALWLLFKLPKILTRRFTINKEDAIAYNEKVDKENEGKTYKEAKKELFLGNYFNNVVTMVGHTFFTYGGYVGAVYLIYMNILPWIKVTFFSKLYLVELVLKYI